MWKPGSSNVEQPPSDCSPALGTPPWGNSEVEDDVLIGRGNAKGDPQRPCAPSSFLRSEGLYQPRHLQNQFWPAGPRVNIAKADDEVSASRLQELNRRPGQRGASGAPASRYSWHTSSSSSPPHPNSPTPSLHPGSLLPPQARDAEASTAGAVGAVQSRAGNSRLFIGGRPRLPGPRLALHNLPFLLPPVRSAGRGWVGGWEGSLMEPSLPLLPTGKLRASSSWALPLLTGMAAYDRRVNSPAPLGTAASLALGEVSCSGSFPSTATPPGQGSMQVPGPCLFSVTLGQLCL